jgi:hypothetical protein
VHACLILQLESGISSVRKSSERRREMWLEACLILWGGSNCCFIDDLGGLKGFIGGEGGGGNGWHGRGVHGPIVTAEASFSVYKLLAFCWIHSRIPNTRVGILRGEVVVGLSFLDRLKLGFVPCRFTSLFLYEWSISFTLRVLDLIIEYINQGPF